MSKVSEMTRPYFSHDEDARGDDKILKLFFSFRKRAKEMTREELEVFVPLGAYGIFWSVLEYMHRNSFKAEDIELLSDDLRIPEKFVLNVLEDFELFEKEENCYISKRLIEDIEKAAEKSKKNTEAITKRWAMSNLKKYYEEIFGATPILEDSEINKFLDYYDKIDDFKKRLPDILFTLKELKFDNNPQFNPSINWLLTENHMGKLVNGEYGKLKNWAAHKAKLKAAEKALKEQQAQQEKEEREYVDPETITTKVGAIEYICKHSPNLEFMSLPCKQLMKKFDITKEELRKEKENMANSEAQNV